VHARKRIADGDDLGLLGRQFVESESDFFGILKQASQSNVRRVVTRLGLEQRPIKFLELSILHVIAEQFESLARSSFDQPRDQ
jgi:hypothetical protein